MAAWLNAGLEWHARLRRRGAAGAGDLAQDPRAEKREVDAASNADVNLDIGQIVSVEAWSDNRTARVWYRGAHWQAELAEGHAPHGGEHVITELRGTRLVLTPRNASGGAR